MYQGQRIDDAICAEIVHIKRAALIVSLPLLVILLVEIGIALWML